MERYSRHRNLYSESQFALIRKARVLVAGAGGLGSTVIQLLARLGVETIYIYDYANVDLPDLNRQILYEENDIGKSKTLCAASKISAINKEVKAIALPKKIDINISIPNVDVVFDCLDNFEARFILDDILYKNQIPFIHGGINKYYAQVTSIVPGLSKTLSELFPINSNDVDRNMSKDIFPPVATFAASIQVSEGIKFITKQKDKMLINKVMMIDLLTNNFEIVDFK